MHDERRALIDEILDARGQSGYGLGIFGTKICQACGRPGNFSGWAGAMAAHRHGVFIALGHHHEDGAIRSALLEGAPRYCAVCSRPAASRRTSMQLREQDPLCEGCLVAGTDADRAAQLRFLDERNPTIAALRGLRDRSERTLALEGTAPSREIVAARVAARRTLRRLDRSWIGRLARRRRARAAMNAPSG